MTRRRRRRTVLCVQNVGPGVGRLVQIFAFGAIHAPGLSIAYGGLVPAISRGQIRRGTTGRAGPKV